jgi:SAM-dependent methyltransferase
MTDLGRSPRDPGPKIGLLLLEGTSPSAPDTFLDGLPEDLRVGLSQVFVTDRARPSAEHADGLGHQEASGAPALTSINHRRGLDYGARQKAAFRLAIERGLDIIVVLRGSEQHTPELLGDLVAPLSRGECDAVFGSGVPAGTRAPHRAVPARTALANGLLTRLENRMLGTKLSDLDSACRAYSVEALASVPFEANSDGHEFDIEIIIQLVGAGKRIGEIPVRTDLWPERWRGGVLGHTKDVALDVLRYRLAKVGFFFGGPAQVGDEYQLKNAENASHSIILRWLEQIPPARVLDVGCSSGLLGQRMRALGHTVTGVDIHELPGVLDRCDRFVQADLDVGLPQEVMRDGPYDVAVAADLLEHVREPELLLDQIASVLVPRGRLIVSVPNFGHWYPRTRTALGLFDYDQRGILDRGHVRFFTRRGLLSRLEHARFVVLREQATGLPLEVLTRREGPIKRLIHRADRAGVGRRPQLFGYQFVIQCETLTPALLLSTSQVDASALVAGSSGSRLPAVASGASATSGRVV